MPAPCFTSQIATAINSGCSTQVVGVEEKAVILPLSLINKATLAYDADSLIVNTLALTTGTGVAVNVRGDMPFSDMTFEGEKLPNGQIKFDKTAIFRILGNNPAISKQVMQLGVGKYAMVFQMKGYAAADKNKYMIVGLDRGLSLTTASYSQASQDEFGWNITLVEPEALTSSQWFWPAAGEAAADSWFAGLTA